MWQLIFICDDMKLFLSMVMDIMIDRINTV